MAFRATSKKMNTLCFTSNVADKNRSFQSYLQKILRHYVLRQFLELTAIASEPPKKRRCYASLQLPELTTIDFRAT